MFLLSAFALLALVLTSVGIVGVVSYSVTQRTHEVGIRMALGARSADVLGLIVGRSMLWVFAGLGAGLGGAALVTRLLGNLLFDVRPIDPVVFGSVSALLVAVALLACYVPARRATKVDPMAALRYE